jgi:hypothetical protein
MSWIAVEIAEIGSMSFVEQPIATSQLPYRILRGHFVGKDFHQDTAERKKQILPMTVRQYEENEEQSQNRI